MFFSAPTDLHPQVVQFEGVPFGFAGVVQVFTSCVHALALSGAADIPAAGLQDAAPDDTPSRQRPRFDEPTRPVPATLTPQPDPVPGPRPATPLRFRGGLPAAALPIVVFAAGAAWLGFSGAPDERGLWPVLLAAIGVGLVLARRPADYGAAVIRGMSRPIVMLMVMAWLLAGVFSVLLRESGLVHALVWAGGELGVRGGGFVLLAFLIAVLFSTATGTSLGTILICAPLLYPAAGVLDAHPTLLIGAILAGATFGDNVSPVSDTTIASASSQRAPMGGVVRSRLRYALPAAAAAALVLLTLGGADVPPGAAGAAASATAEALATASAGPAALPMLLAPLATFLMLWGAAAWWKACSRGSRPPFLSRWCPIWSHFPS